MEEETGCSRAVLLEVEVVAVLLAATTVHGEPAGAAAAE